MSKVSGECVRVLEGTGAAKLNREDTETLEFGHHTLVDLTLLQRGVNLDSSTK